jgi:hypothetical protein
MSWYGFYKQALGDRYIRMLMDNVDMDSLPFDDLFGDKLRIAIPLMNNSLLNMISKLENGETRSGNSYIVDLKTNSVIKVGDESQRKMKAGKIIGRELGKEYLDEWSRQVASVNKDDDGYAIVISRHPIDVMRMSDHDDIDSCHGEGKQYFHCAINEAEEGGPIAYVVNKEDLQDLDLQANEILTDRNRNISGIIPISRMRLNRYINEVDEYEFAVPTNSIYGNLVSGFKESVKDWSYKNQKNKFEEHGIPKKEDLIRRGGSYADRGDDILLNSFFGVNTFKGDVRFEGEDQRSRAEIWDEELDGFKEQYEKEFEHFSIYAEVEDDGGDGAYMQGSYNLFLEFEDYLTHEDDYFDDRSDGGFYEIFNNFYLDGISDVHIEVVGDGDLRIFINFETEMNNPDDYKNLAETLLEFEQKEFDKLVYKIESSLVENGIIADNLTPLLNYAERFNFNNFHIDVPNLEDEQFTISIRSNPISTIPLPNMVHTPEFEKLKEQIYQKIKKTIADQPFLFDDMQPAIATPPDISFDPSVNGSTFTFQYEMLPYKASLTDLENIFSHIGELDRAFPSISNVINSTITEGVKNILEDNENWWRYIKKDKDALKALPHSMRTKEFSEQLKEKYYQMLAKDGIRGIDASYYGYFGDDLKTPEYVQAMIEYINEQIHLSNQHFNKYERGDISQSNLIDLLDKIRQNHPEIYSQISEMRTDSDLVNMKELQKILRYNPNGGYSKASGLYQLITDPELKKQAYIQIRQTFLENLKPNFAVRIREGNFPYIFHNDNDILQICYDHLIDMGKTPTEIINDYEGVSQEIRDYASKIQQVYRNYGFDEFGKPPKNAKTNFNWYCAIKLAYI